MYLNSHDDIAVLLDSVTALLFNHYSMRINSSMANKGPLFLDQDPDLVNDQIMMSDDGEHTEYKAKEGMSERCPKPSYIVRSIHFLFLPCDPLLWLPI